MIFYDKIKYIYDFLYMIFYDFMRDKNLDFLSFFERTTKCFKKFHHTFMVF